MLEMSCIACQSKFTFFTRENGCPNCGFSYCGKCLKYKCNLASGQAKKVCGSCYNKLTMSAKSSPGESSSSDRTPSEVPQGERPIAPMDIINKMEALENPVKPPIVIYKRRALDNLKVGLEPADREILERLKRLKDEDKQPSTPGVDEISRRLAILKDQDPDAIRQSVNINQTDTRTDSQKEDDLIKEYLERLRLSSGSDPTKDVRARLDSLKDLNPSERRSHASSESDDEDAATRKLIERALEEARLDSKCDRMSDASEDMEVENPEDEPQCCICDATNDLVVCDDCDDDEVYCNKCLKESHDDGEIEDHRPKPYKRERKPEPD